MNIIPKFNLGEKQTTWKHHRSGWNCAIKHLSDLHTPYGVRFEGYADGVFSVDKKGPIKNKWVGVLHNTPTHPDSNLIDTSKKYDEIKSLSKLFISYVWINSISSCQGIFTLSKYTEKFIKQKNPNLIVSSIVHPIDDIEIKFNFNKFIKNNNKKIVILGHWLRRFNTFGKLKTIYKKAIVRMPHSYIIVQKVKSLDNFSDIDIIPKLNNEQFDELLQSNIIFLDLYDVSACNTILDCIARNTPILTRRLPASEEYLGKDYPFFFNSMEEANEKISSVELIKTTTNYLMNIDKNRFNKYNFIKSIVESEIYKNIKYIKFLE